MKTKRTARVTELMIHNPQLPATWPGERTRNYMKTKNRNQGVGSRSHKKTNSSTALQKRANGGKPQTITKYRSRPSPWRNPLSKFSRIGGVNVIDIGVAGLTLLVCQGVSFVLPGDPNSWTKFFIQVG